VSIAPILERSIGKIRFRVDEVDRATTLLATDSAKSQLELRFVRAVSLDEHRELLAFSHDATFETIATDEGEIHPLVLAVHRAFSEHRPLQLTPDILWITLAQGFAQHINNHAETLRSRFVRHQGKEKLIVEVLETPTQSQHWAEKIEEWVLQIRDLVGVDCYRLLECNFSTTTPISRTVSHVVMMDAFKQYFDFVMLCICGIPEVTLLGTVADWQSIRDRVCAMAEYDLEWWTARMLPICDEFIATASGKPSLEFWQCIYKPKPVYGGELITGWLADLFPYLQDDRTHAPTVRNPLLVMDRCELPKTDALESHNSFFSKVDGIAPNRIPLGLSMVSLAFTVAHTSKEYPLDLIAGFIGVSQAAEHLTLQPELGWMVRSRDDRWSNLLDRIEREHLTNAPIDWTDLHMSEMPKDLLQMLERFDGVKLYADSGHSWQIAPCREWNDYRTVPDEYLPDVAGSFATPFITLDDGRSIAFNFNYHSGDCWFLLCRVAVDEECDKPVVIAKSAVELFERIFAADGCYYFDRYDLC
jgi:hypothetical protein